MLALIQEIKNAVILLGYDSEPEDVQLRACMGITTELMKELRNTIVESGQYSELVTSYASQVLAECRSQLGLLYRRVPCHAEGCPVTAEVQRYFLEVMNNVIELFDELIKESLNNRNSRDPQNGKLKARLRNLKLFKKLISKKQSSKRRRKTELDPRDYLDSELRESEHEFGIIQEENEPLKSSETALDSELSVLTPNRSNLISKLRVQMKHCHHSQSQMADCKTNWRQAEPLALPENYRSNEKLATEVQENLRDAASSTSSEPALEDLSGLSTIPLAGSISNIRSYSNLERLTRPEKDKPKPCVTSKSLSHLQVLLARADKPMALSSSSSEVFLVKKRNSWHKSRQILKPTTSSNVTLKNIGSTEIRSASSSQLSMARQKTNRLRETKKPKSTSNYFSVGKTFGDHRLRLLRWCQEKTKKYGIPMYEFSESWRSGHALVAIIYSYRKDLIEDRFNPNRLSKESPKDILTCGAKAAKSLGLNSEVEIVRVCQQKVPDFCKVFTFVSELHRCLEPKLY